MGIEGSFSGQDHEAENPPTSSVMVKKGGAITPFTYMPPWYNA
jgi:hypothetical protein